MDPVTSTTASTQNVTQSTATTKPAAVNVTAAQTKFETLLKANLAPDKSNKVSEEELFAALIPQRLSKLKGDDAAKKFADELKVQTGALKKGDGFVPFEEAAKNALKKLVTDKVLTADEADKVYSESFAGAQLDSNKNALYDSRGGKGDTTIAVEDLEKALLASRLKIEAFDSGTEKADSRKLNEATPSSAQATAGAGLGATPSALTAGTVVAQGGKIDGKGGVLFKPVGGDGKLAILSANGDQIEGIVIKDQSGNVIDTGRFTSFGDDPSQNVAKYAFSKAGGSYGKNITVEIKLKNGGVQDIQIADPSKRYD